MTNKTFCCVYGCRSSGKSADLSFHLFPKVKRTVPVVNKFGVTEKVDQRTAWERSLKMGKTSSKFMRVCSRHFSDDCYVLPGIPTEKRRLKLNAVPDCNLPVLPKRGSVKRPKKRRLLQRESQQKSSPLECRGVTPHEDENCEEDCGQLLNEVTNELVEANISPEGLRTWRSVEVQVKSGDLFTPFISFVTSDAIVNTLTGVPRIEMFDMLVCFVNKKLNDRRKHKLSAKERVLMALMKLKLNLPFSLLKVLFQSVVGSTCKLIFEETLTILSSLLKRFIVLPTQEEIKKNLPKCFANFSDCKMVIDCTEIYVQKPKCLKCRIKLYSQYKSGLTIKFLTGVTPSGLICFVSKPYGGRASDKAIFEQSNVISMLDAGDALMVDKGFLIDDICRVSKVKLIRPIFLQNKQQLSKKDALATRDIAAARVHVERSNQRIKLFKFFNNKIEWSLSSLVEDAFIVVCGLTNLGSPILANDKF